MKKILITISLIILLGLGIFLLNKKEDLLQTNNILAIYIKQEDGNYEKTNTIPESGYMLNEERSVCSNNAKPNWNINTNSLKINNLRSNNTNCYLYFDSLAKTKILANKTLTNRPEINGPLTTDGNDVYYEALDDDGLSQYFAGVVDNNWVRFAGYYWRIVRINGDGTIRIIYNGPTTDQTGETTQIGVSAFNNLANDNAYVGYMYGTPGSNTYEETHANINDSTIKKVIDNWYETNIANNSNFVNKIDVNAGFCNDRSIKNNEDNLSWSMDTKKGYGLNYTAYNGFSKFGFEDSYKNIFEPALDCPNINHDLFTSKTSIKGNKKLTYPIGLITADEIVYAGAFGSQESNYYLNNNLVFWTMTADRFYKNDMARVFIEHFETTLGNYETKVAAGVRPVINLKANVTLTGNGTKDNPYIVEGAE